MPPKESPKACWGFDPKAWKDIPKILKTLTFTYSYLFPTTTVHRDLDSVEVFAGKHQLTQAMVNNQMKAVFRRSHGPQEAQH